MRINFVSCQIVKERSINYQAEEINKIAIKGPYDVFKIATDVLNLNMASEEYFYIVMLNAKNKINAIAEVSHGSLNASIVHPREIFKHVFAFFEANFGDYDEDYSDHGYDCYYYYESEE